MTEEIAVSIAWGCASFAVAFAASYSIYMWGYVRGYKAAMRYSSAKLDEYHDYTMKSIQELARKR